MPVIAATGLVAATLAACGSTGERVAAPADLQVPVALGLKRDTKGLEAWLSSASNPTSSDFLSTLSNKDLTSKFGPNQAEVNQLLSDLRARGFEGNSGVNGSVITGTLPVALANELFDTEIVIEDKGTTQVASPTKTPQVSGNWGSLVTEVVGLQRTVPHSETPTIQVSEQAQSHDVQSSAAPGRAASTPKCPSSSSDTSKFQKFYGIDSLFALGATGAGVSVASIQTAEVSNEAIALARKCSKTHVPTATPKVVTGTDKSSLLKSSPEPTLDAMAAGVMAPGLKELTMYQFDQYQSIVFPLSSIVTDSFAPKGPEILSSSIGVCESAMTNDERSLAEWIIASGAAGGLTTVASAGDYGSSGCYPQTQDQAAQYPAASTFATGVGGTQIDFDTSTQAKKSTTAVENVWRAGNTNAGGGAQKTSVSRPSYQEQLPGPNNRLVPDIAAVADPTEFKMVPVCVNSNCSFQGVGGTSASAPGIAAGLATVTQYLRKASKRSSLKLGEVNPFLYQVATSSQGKATFRDVTTGSNDLFDVGCCTAAVGYDSASGWGSLNFDKLARAYSRAAKK